MFPTEYAKAVEAAQSASRIINKYYDQNYQVEYKRHDQPVTIADREANDNIRHILLTAFPEDGWLSEETRDDPARLSKKRVWIVDPLDGTREFIAKVREFAVSIALVLEGRPVVGVVMNPATGELFSACENRGAFLNGQAIHVSPHAELKTARMLASRSEISRHEWDGLHGQMNIIPSGGMACKMTEVACGRADATFSLNPKTEWDFAAGVLIVQGAGGRVVHIDGEPFSFNKPNPRAQGIITSNESLFSQVVKLVNTLGAVAK